LGVLAFGWAVTSGVSKAVRGGGVWLEGSCAELLVVPRPRVVRLSGCRLDTENLVLEREGTFELLGDRQAGHSNDENENENEKTPRWTQLYAPIVVPGVGRHPVFAVYQISDPDVLTWVNNFETASDETRTIMLERRDVLERIAAPGLLLGEVDRGAEVEAIRRVLGGKAALQLQVVRPGAPEPPGSPLFEGFVAVVGVVLTLFGLGIVRWPTTPRALDEANGVALDLSSVEVKLGELEALRREERERDAPE
jgi:hypothetical protein